MLKRTLHFGNPFHISTSLNQMKLTNKATGEERTLPVEDLGFVVFEHPQITFTQGIMRLLAENKVAVVFCDEKYHPSSVLLHLDGNLLQTKRFRSQLDASEPLKKKLWQQTIEQKLRNQALLLDANGRDGEAVLYKSKQVKSGDTTNEEAKGASVYWNRLFGRDFNRERFGEAPNALLNYGYAILRAATARALSGSGLHPTLGIHHQNQFNSFCLADDIMEPYRPYVDQLVLDFLEENEMVNELDKNIKAHLLGVLSMDVMINGKRSPLMVALSHTTASLADCFAGEKRKLKFPEFAS
ncbi:type II CRISPR-associated endonuclease Cas1 [Owenweeksia hongkongensis]|uniref:type II CRISPR-associated endonuclease Cas1 n=1 Tax=Owenweeksia hongkongensis TaxID=253245 RepID=UPI003A8D7B6E